MGDRWETGGRPMGDRWETDGRRGRETDGTRGRETEGTRGRDARKGRAERKRVPDARSEVVSRRARRSYGLFRDRGIQHAGDRKDGFGAQTDPRVGAYFQYKMFDGVSLRHAPVDPVRVIPPGRFRARAKDIVFVVFRRRRTERARLGFDRVRFVRIRCQQFRRNASFEVRANDFAIRIGQNERIFDRSNVLR